MCLFGHTGFFTSDVLPSGAGRGILIETLVPEGTIPKLEEDIFMSLRQDAQEIYTEAIRRALPDVAVQQALNALGEVRGRVLLVSVERPAGRWPGPPAASLARASPPALSLPNTTTAAAPASPGDLGGRPSHCGRCLVPRCRKGLGAGPRSHRGGHRPLSPLRRRLRPF